MKDEIHSFINERQNAFIHSWKTKFIDSFMKDEIHSFIHERRNSFIHSWKTKFIHSFMKDEIWKTKSERRNLKDEIYSFIHLFIHSWKTKSERRNPKFATNCRNPNDERRKTKLWLGLLLISKDKRRKTKNWQQQQHPARTEAQPARPDAWYHSNFVFRLSSFICSLFHFKKGYISSFSSKTQWKLGFQRLGETRTRCIPY